MSTVASALGERISVPQPLVEVRPELMALEFEGLRLRHAQRHPTSAIIGSSDEVVCDTWAVAGQSPVPLSPQIKQAFALKSSTVTRSLAMGLVGRALGQPIELNYELPLAFPLSEFAGASVTLHVVPHAAQRIELPADNDSVFLAATGLGKTLADVRLAIKKQVHEALVAESKLDIADVIAATIAQRLGYQPAPPDVKARQDASFAATDSLLWSALKCPPPFIARAKGAYLSSKTTEGWARRDAIRVFVANALVAAKRGTAAIEQVENGRLTAPALNALADCLLKLECVKIG